MNDPAAAFKSHAEQSYIVGSFASNATSFTIIIRRMNDFVADHDAELAMLVGMSGVSVEEASWALDESGGNIDQAIVRLTTCRVSGDAKTFPMKMVEETQHDGNMSLRSSSLKQPGTNFRRHGVEDFDDSIAITPNPRPSSGYEKRDGKQCDTTILIYCHQLTYQLLYLYTKCPLLLRRGCLDCFSLPRKEFCRISFYSRFFCSHLDFWHPDIGK
jgi:hypothetical protein